MPVRIDGRGRKGRGTGGRGRRRKGGRGGGEEESAPKLTRVLQCRARRAGALPGQRLDLARRAGPAERRRLCQRPVGANVLVPANTASPPVSAAEARWSMPLEQPPLPARYAPRLGWVVGRVTSTPGRGPARYRPRRRSRRSRRSARCPGRSRGRAGRGRARCPPAARPAAGTAPPPGLAHRRPAPAAGPPPPPAAAACCCGGRSGSPSVRPVVAPPPRSAGGQTSSKWSTMRSMHAALTSCRAAQRRSGRGQVARSSSGIIVGASRIVPPRANVSCLCGSAWGHRHRKTDQPARQQRSIGLAFAGAVYGPVHKLGLRS